MPVGGASSSRLPIKAIHPSATPQAFSPHDSLADEVGNSKGTGYFLRFNDPDKASRRSRIPVHSPTKGKFVLPRSLPKKSASSFLPKPNAAARRTRLPKRLATSEPIGSRTRSVSPKVLKRDGSSSHESSSINARLKSQLEDYVNSRAESLSHTIAQLQSDDHQTELYREEKVAHIHSAIECSPIGDETVEWPIEISSTIVDPSAHNEDIIMDTCQLNESCRLLEVISNESVAHELTNDFNLIGDTRVPHTREDQQPMIGYHELDLSDEDKPNEIPVVNLCETERDSTSTTTPSTPRRSDSAELENNTQTLPDELTSLPPFVPTSKAASRLIAGVQTSTRMSSSWMDRLKEDLDNDDEWLSDEAEMEAELQRERERKMRERQRTLSSSSSDGEPPRPAPRRQDSPGADADYSSSDDERTGFAHARAGPNRQSVNRGAGPRYVLSDEEDEPTRDVKSPAVDEMDLMVQRNLAYVNQEDLDQMDILTTDLNIPAGQLRLEPGEGELVASTAVGKNDMAQAMLGEPRKGRAASGAVYIDAGEGVDAKEDSDGDAEVTGTIEVIGAQDELTQPQGTDHQMWMDKLEQYGGAEYRYRSDSDSSSSSREKETVKNKFVFDLADQLREIRDSEPEETTPRAHIIQEDLLSACSNNPSAFKERILTEPDMEVRVDVNMSKSPRHLVVEDYSQPSKSDHNARGRSRLKLLSQQYEQFEDELPSPGKPIASKINPSDLECLPEEGVTSFGAEPSDKQEGAKEKVEDSMQDKIRNWKNMSAESAVGRVEEWQALGNFNTSPNKHDRVCHVDSNEPSVKHARLHTNRGDSGVFDDVNAGRHHQASDSGSDNEGYGSDNSSQDTVRENIKKQPADDQRRDSVDSRASKDLNEPEYVEIIGGEEPPDEWLNLENAIGRPTLQSSSSDDDSSSNESFHYVAQPHQLPAIVNRLNDHQPSYDQVPAVPANRTPLREASPVEDVDRSLYDDVPADDYQEQVHYDLVADGEERAEQVYYDSVPDENVPMEYDIPEPAVPKTESESFSDSELFAREMTRTPELSSPEATREMVVEPAADDSILEEEEEAETMESQIPETVERKSSTSSSSSSEHEPESEPEPAITEPKKRPLAQDLSYERVEKLRQEMKATRTSHSVDSSQLTRPSRTSEKLSERMKSFDDHKTSREVKRYPSPHRVLGVQGKFSAAFSRFESPTRDGKRVSTPSSLKSTNSPQREQEVKKPEKPNKVESVKSLAKDELRKPVPIDELIKPTISVAVQSAPTSKYEIEPEAKPIETRDSPRKSEDSPISSPRVRRVNLGTPKKSSQSKLNDKLAKFGEPVSAKSDQDTKRMPTVTTRNPETNRFERFNNKDLPRGREPHFDVDIVIKKENAAPAHSSSYATLSNNETAQITLGDRGVQLSKLNRPAKPPVVEEGFMNVWDTKTPVTDPSEKVLKPMRLHVTKMSTTLSNNSPASSKPRPASVSDVPPMSRAKSEPRFTRQPTLEPQEVSVVVRPQFHSTNPSTSRPTRMADSPDGLRQRVSMPANPRDQIEPLNATRLSSARQADYTRTQSLSPTRPLPSKQRDQTAIKEGDSLDELRHGLRPRKRIGNLVAQNRNMFSREEPNAGKYQPSAAASKPFSNKKAESQPPAHVKEAIGQLVELYDDLDLQNEKLMEGADHREYNSFYSRDSLDYTSKWLENNDKNQHFKMAPTNDLSPVSQPEPDPVKDDVALRRQQQYNRTLTPRQYAHSSYINESSHAAASSVPSGTSDVRDRGRSTEPRRTNRPSRRARSLPRKPSRAIAERASIFSQEEPKRAQEAPASSQPVSRYRSQSPKPVSIKDRRPGPHSSDGDYDKLREHAPDVTSPKTNSKGVAMIVELYNKTKDYPLEEVNEQTVSQLNSEMFDRRPTTPDAGRVEDAPLSASAWKTWLSSNEKNQLEQRVENVYNKQPIKPQEAVRPAVRQDRTSTGGWKPPHQAAPVSPPRPMKSDTVRQAAERTTWSSSPPPPTVPQRRYESYVPSQNGFTTNPDMVDFEGYKQQTLQRFKEVEDDTYARIQRPLQREPEIQPTRASGFDQALLIQAPPPKPERLFNTAEPWETYQPTQDPYQKPYQQQPSHGQVTPSGYNQPSGQGYHSLPQNSEPYHPREDSGRTYQPSRPENGYQSSAPPRDQYSYPQQPAQNSYNGHELNRANYRQPSHPQPIDRQPQYPQRQTQYPDKQHQYADRQPQYPDRQHQSHYPQSQQPQGQHPQQSLNRHPSDAYQQQPAPTRQAPRRTGSFQRSEHSDTRSNGAQPTNGYRSPQGSHDPYRPSHPETRYSDYPEPMQPPRRTNSVPNIKQQVSPGRLQAIQQDPRYHHPADDQSFQNHGSLPRANRQKDYNRSFENSMPEFVPIQQATRSMGRAPPRTQPDYNHRYSNPNPNYEPRHSRYTPSYGPPEPFSRQRPGVGVVYNTDYGVSDF